MTTNSMKILKIEDYNYSIVYIEYDQKTDVYKRFTNGDWLRLKRNSWVSVENADELEKLFKEYDIRRTR
jgi:hypothetical protein